MHLVDDKTLTRRLIEIQRGDIFSPTLPSLPVINFVTFPLLS
jgi:hypothetical protein